ncbi:MAG: hypothetical protein NTZ49_01265 [Candidatus Parcubacteria bacterium]|nr:hypothetical protein [Candidatus Parcubacteria bacterium]
MENQINFAEVQKQLERFLERLYGVHQPMYLDGHEDICVCRFDCYKRSYLDKYGSYVVLARQNGDKTSVEFLMSIIGPYDFTIMKVSECENVLTLKVKWFSGSKAGQIEDLNFDFSNPVGLLAFEV